MSDGIAFQQVVYRHLVLVFGLDCLSCNKGKKREGRKQSWQSRRRQRYIRRSRGVLRCTTSLLLLTTISTEMAEPVGDFYVHLVDGADVSKDLTSSTKLLSSKKIPTVIHFYDGG